MNIQRFYQKLAIISLNASIVALIPSIILSLFWIIVFPTKPYILFIIPFLLYSLFSYQIYLINTKRAKEASVHLLDGINDVHLLDANEMLITFLPAPSLRLLFFHCNGQQIGEIRDVTYSPYRWLLPDFLDKQMGGKYGLYDVEEHLVATFQIRKDRITIFPLKGEPILIAKTRHVGKDLIFYNGEVAFSIKQSSLFTDYQIYKGEMMVSRLRKGVLPLEWGKRFIDPNTPVLSLKQTLAEKEKLLIFAMLSDFLRYTDH